LIEGAGRAAAIRIGAIIQARTSSRRLPGKVLRELAGKPLLQHLIDGLRHADEVDLIVLATSAEVSDDELAEFAVSSGLEAHRGPLDDVARRFRDAAAEHSLDAFARVNGDSPLFDHRLLETAIRRFREGGFDLVTNVLRRTYPTGQSIEVVDSRCFERVYPELSEPGDLENVTPYFYRHPERFRIASFESPTSYQGLRLAVDTEEDFQRVESMLARMDRPHWEYDVDELVALMREAS
jgi:spore coat polysaccharide biosynthesis protein SpsF